MEVVEGVIFMEEKLRSKLVLGWLAVLKIKIWVDYEQLLMPVYSSFIYFLKFLNIFSIRSKSLYKMKMRNSKRDSLRFSCRF